MGVVFVPIYIRYIGIEAYGIIGFFVALQSLFTILDLGLSATLNRELARRSDAAGNADDTRDLVRTLEWICWPTGALIVFAVWAASGSLAEDWLRPVSLSVEKTADALFLLGLATALQWPVSFYTGGLGIAAADSAQCVGRRVFDNSFSRGALRIVAGCAYDRGVSLVAGRG